MKLARPLLIGSLAVVVVLGVALGVALTPGFQTWALHRTLAKHPELGITVGQVKASLGRAALTDVHVERNGYRYHAPKIEAELPVLAAVFSHRLHLVRLVANGWTFDGITAPAHGPAPAVSVRGETNKATSSPPPPGAPNFSGFFQRLDLPFDLTIDTMEARGEITLPAVAGTAAVQISGGGLTAQTPGKFEITSSVAINGDLVKNVQVHAVIVPKMATSRTFSSIAISVDATATGQDLAAPVVVQGDLRASREANRERYVISLSQEKRELVSGEFDYTATAHPIEGTWKIDLRESDVAPFTLGYRWPNFTLRGEGRIESDTTFTQAHLRSRLDATVDHLEVVAAHLSAIGPLKLSSDIDAQQHGSVLSIEKLNASVTSDHPVASIDALQRFDFDVSTGEVRAADPARDLLGVALKDVPLAWIRPFIPRLMISGANLRGELVASPRGGGISVKTKTPLMTSGVEVDFAGEPWLRGLDVQLNAAGDYTPHGWQAEVTGTTARTGASTILLLDAKAGRLSGAAEPVRATALISVDVAALAKQPGAHGAPNLQRGDATIEFAGRFGAKREIEAKIGLRNLLIDAAGAPPLPTIQATLRADIAADGRIAANIPITLEQADRKSDIGIVANIAPLSTGGAFEAQVSSGHLVMNDAKALAGIFSPKSKATEPAKVSPPRWTNLNGTLGLQLKEIVYSETLILKNVTGTVRFSGGTMSTENVHAGMGDEGGATVSGRLSFDRNRPNPYALGANVGLLEFNPATVLRTLNRSAVSVVDGKCSVGSQLAAEAPTIAGLRSMATGTFELTSRGGTFRGLPVNVGNLVENSSKLASWIASAGNAISSLTGKKEDYEEITSRSQAANELARMLSAINYDQLNIVITRPDPVSATVKEFALISPDVRLNGSGRAQCLPGRSVYEDEVLLDLQLRARGRMAELMRYLGILEAKPDELGYAACTIPVRVAGTLARLDSQEFSNRLIAVAVEKSGVLERAGAKAMDWINRLRGR